MKILLNSFHLNGNTVGFYPQIQKLEVQRIKQRHRKVLLNGFHVNGHFYRNTISYLEFRLYKM